MKIIETDFSGLFTIDIEPVFDERGMFARCWCKNELTQFGLVADLDQCGISFSKTAGTLRGMHFQATPHEETKIIRCTMGSIYDVVVDLRAESETYKKWFGLVLSAENHRLLYVPRGFAHGLMTLEPNTEVLYQISEFYVPDLARGVRYDDPAFDIKWPIEPTVISQRDTNYPDFTG
jgi:dTDP-4-dehydrorhamnose 3,5-epimerase